ncbi:hypothetical protein K1719_037015 [Acacia pycnantha]|nr:hypothetical protein K1719_037015 [Acacia pycnantha]
MIFREQSRSPELKGAIAMMVRFSVRNDMRRLQSTFTVSRRSIKIRNVLVEELQAVDELEVMLNVVDPQPCYQRVNELLSQVKKIAECDGIFESKRCNGTIVSLDNRIQVGDRDSACESARLNDELAKIQESVEASPLVKAVSNHGRSCLSESYRTEECGEIPETLKIALKNLVVNADRLRMNTALKMVEILKPNQAVFA